MLVRIVFLTNAEVVYVPGKPLTSLKLKKMLACDEKCYTVNTCFREFYTCFGCETETGLVRNNIFFIFKTYVQPYHSNCLGKSFPLIRLNTGLYRKIRE